MAARRRATSSTSRVSVIPRPAIGRPSRSSSLGSPHFDLGQDEAGWDDVAGGGAAAGRHATSSTSRVSAISLAGLGRGDRGQDVVITENVPPGVPIRRRGVPMLREGRRPTSPAPIASLESPRPSDAGNRDSARPIRAYRRWLPPRSIRDTYAGLESSTKSSADHLGCSPTLYLLTVVRVHRDRAQPDRRRHPGPGYLVPLPTSRRAQAPFRQSGLHCSTPVRLLQSSCRI